MVIVLNCSNTYIGSMPNQNQALANTITVQSKSSFYYSFLFLSKAKRNAIQTVYAFCRISDDIVDEMSPVEVKKAALENWRSLFIKSEHSNVSHPILDQLTRVIKAYNINRKYFLDILDGMEMDLKINNYRSFEELLEYTYRVASVVGLISIEIFGYQNTKTQDYAINLGTALQLTNIIRDAYEDAQNNRFYLPECDFNTFSYRHSELLRMTTNEAYFSFMEFQYNRAQLFYEKATQVLPQEDQHNMIVPEMMRMIYYKTLTEIKSEDFNIFKKRISLSKGKKLSTAFMVFLKSILPNGK